MSHDYRPAHHQHDHARPHRRKPQRRTVNRETVQSEELSSTNGIRMVKDAQSFNIAPYYRCRWCSTSEVSCG